MASLRPAEPGPSASVSMGIHLEVKLGLWTGVSGLNAGVAKFTDKERKANAV